MICEKVAEIEESYLLGELDEKERSQVERHLQDCPRCARRIAGYEDVLGRMFSSLEPVTPPVRVRQAVLAQTGKAPALARWPVQPDRARWRLPGFSSPVFGPVYGALAAVLVLALAAWGLVLNSQLQDARKRQAEADALLAMATSPDSWVWGMQPAGSDLPAGTKARMYARPGSSLYLVTATGLPPAPAGKVYTAWYTLGSHFERAGALSPDAAGNVTLLVNDPTNSAAAITACMINLENSGAAPGQPTGPPLLQWKKG